MPIKRNRPRNSRINMGMFDRCVEMLNIKTTERIIIDILFRFLLSSRFIKHNSTMEEKISGDRVLTLYENPVVKVRSKIVAMNNKFRLIPEKKIPNVTYNNEQRSIACAKIANHGLAARLICLTKRP